MSGATREQGEFTVVNKSVTYSLWGIGIVEDVQIGYLAVP
jgi:hypothetical protein